MKKIIGFLSILFIAICSLLIFGKAATTEASEQEIIISVEDLTSQDLKIERYTSTYITDTAIYSNSDQSVFYIIDDSVDGVSTLNNSDQTISSVSFVTSCAENNVVWAENSEGQMTLLNYDGSYYAGLSGYYNVVSLAYGDDADGSYYVYDGTNTIFYNGNGEQLFKILGEPQDLTWGVIGGYNYFSGTVGGVSYNNFYDNDLNQVCKYIYAESYSNSKGYVMIYDSEVVFYNSLGTELFKIDGSYNYIRWTTYGEYYYIDGYDSDGNHVLDGIYNSSLESVFKIPDNSSLYFRTYDQETYYLCTYTSGIATVTDPYTYYDTNLQVITAPDNGVDTSNIMVNENYSVLGYYYYEIDGVECVYVMMDDKENLDILVNTIYSEDGTEIASGFSGIYSNGVIAYTDSSTGLVKLVQLSAKTVDASLITDVSSDGTTSTATIALSDALYGQSINIGISGSASYIPSGARFSATSLVSGNVYYDKAAALMTSISTKFEVFDIDLLDSSNIKVQPNGDVTITITLPSDFDSSKMKLYRLETDGTLTDMGATVSDGVLTFTTNHFSTYIMAEQNVVAADTTTSTESTTSTTDTTTSTESTTSTTDTTTSTESTSSTTGTSSPQTGDSNEVLLFTGAFVIAVCAFGATVYYKKRNVEL